MEGAVTFVLSLVSTKLFGNEKLAEVIEGRAFHLRISGVILSSVAGRLLILA